MSALAPRVSEWDWGWALVRSAREVVGGTFAPPGEGTLFVQSKRQQMVEAVRTAGRGGRSVEYGWAIRVRWYADRASGGEVSRMHRRAVRVPPFRASLRQLPSCRALSRSPTWSGTHAERDRETPEQCPEGILRPHPVNSRRSHARLRFRLHCRGHATKCRGCGAEGNPGAAACAPSQSGPHRRQRRRVP